MYMLHVFLYYDLDDHGEAIWYVYIWVRRLYNLLFVLEYIHWFSRWRLEIVCFVMSSLSVYLCILCINVTLC